MSSLCMLFLHFFANIWVKQSGFFSKFFNDEIQLSGDWRVALSEIIFPTKIEHVVNGDLKAYSLKVYKNFKKYSFT